MKAKNHSQLDFYLLLFVLLLLFVKLNLASFVNEHGTCQVKSEKSEPEPEPEPEPNSKEKEKEEESQEIPPFSRLVAFGRDGHLGGFYSYPDDKLGPSFFSFFRGEIPNWMRQETASRFNWSRSVVIKKEGAKKGEFYDIFKNFETSDNNMMLERINFLFDRMEVAERGEFLKALKHPNDRNTVMGAVTFAWGTVYEKLEVDWNCKSVGDRLQFPLQLEINLNSDGSSSSSSTSSPRLSFSHVIMGAQHGAICTIRFLLKLEPDPGFDFDFFNEKNLDKTWEEIMTVADEPQSRRRKEIQGHLEKQMKFLRVKNPEKARELFQKYFKQNPSAPKFQLDIYGDIPVPPSLQMTGSKNEASKSESRVKDVYDVLNFIQQVPKLLRKINGGKGWPISFDIVTIKSILEAAESQGKTSQENEKGNTKSFESAPQPISL